MQGLWKEKLGGWNHKDSYRKRTKRKHIVKEKGRALIRRGEGYGTWRKNKKDVSDNFRNEGNYVKAYDIPKVEFLKELVVYNATITYIIGYHRKEVVTIKLTDENTGEVTYRRTYRDVPIKHSVKRLIYIDQTIKPRISKYYGYMENCTYTMYMDYEAGRTIGSMFPNYDIVLRSDSMIRKPIDWEENKRVYESMFSFEYNHYNQKQFMYNKLVSWKADLRKLYNNGRRGKVARKMVNRMDRAKVREYIKNGDWDKEVKTHQYSKSIKWLL